MFHLGESDAFFCMNHFHFFFRSNIHYATFSGLVLCNYVVCAISSCPREVQGHWSTHSSTVTTTVWLVMVTFTVWCCCPYRNSGLLRRSRTAEPRGRSHRTTTFFFFFSDTTEYRELVDCCWFGAFIGTSSHHHLPLSLSLSVCVFWFSGKNRPKPCSSVATVGRVCCWERELGVFVVFGICTSVSSGSIIRQEDFGILAFVAICELGRVSEVDF